MYHMCFLIKCREGNLSSAVVSYLDWFAAIDFLSALGIAQALHYSLSSTLAPSCLSFCLLQVSCIFLKPPS
jgi:hypothetical protein